MLDEKSFISSINLSRYLSSRHIGLALEWLLIILIAYASSGKVLINFDSSKLQQTGEQNENSTLPLLAEIGIWRYREIPLWNPYIMTGLPHVGDFFTHFWNPVSTIPILLWGGINGMKFSVFLAFLVAGLGQWFLAYEMRLRRTFRLWSAILFMISGGLLMLWRVGWYALLLGIVWFPWCMAALLRALQRKTLSSIVGASLAIFMVISAASAYHPLYLFGCLSVLTILLIFKAKPVDRVALVRTAGLIVLLSAALSAVVLVPYLDSSRYITKDALPDKEQQSSQPIQYGIINYFVNTPDWFRAEVLGTASGYNWYYIGWLPVAALAVLPLAYSRSRRHRWFILMCAILFIILMMWFANRYSPFKYIYDLLPILYIFRSPNRLLYVAAIPLLILAALGLEYLYRLSIVGAKDIKLIFSSKGNNTIFLKFRYVITFIWVIGLVITTKEVYDINKGFAFTDQNLNPKTFSVLRWLKEFDPSLYYVNIGGNMIYWWWTPAAYILEMPVINFQHNRHLISWDQQRSEGSPFVARAKYQISQPDQPVPKNAQLLRDFEGSIVWYIPDSLPYAFSTTPDQLQKSGQLSLAQVEAKNVKLSGTNRIVVKGSPRQDGDALVVLMSNYPGWKLSIDGKPAQITPNNGYLGAKMLAGEHTYVFQFLPAQYIIGASISLIALVASIVAIVLDARRVVVQKFRLNRIPAAIPNPAAKTELSLIRENELHRD